MAGQNTITRSRVDEVLAQAVADGAVPSVTAIAADRSGIIYEGAAGSRVAGQTDQLSVDSHYRLMSMSKMITITVALQLMEQGKLDLEAPVERYCPVFAKLQVLERFDGDASRLRPPAGPATVKQLITHTAGASYWFWNADIVKWEAATGVPNVLSGRGEIFKAPLIADPGTRFEYGINIDWLGRVIEAVTGVGLDEAVRRGVTEPLGMDQTAFLMSDAQRANSVPVHLQSDNGAWVASEIELNQRPEYWSGGHGLYSTPRDYMKFQRALLGGGTSADGIKLLESTTVDAAFSNQIGGLDFPAEIVTADPTASNTVTVGPGYKWGYGLLLNSDDLPGCRRAGSGAWYGLFNTHFWIDPQTGITAAIYSQFLPFGPEPSMRVFHNFEEALYASL